MSQSKYNDLNILHCWINNQKAFKKHKKQLTTIYDKIDKKSEKMFGFELEETGKISHQMKETARRFIEKETLEKVTKENIYFYNKKLNSINNRLNPLKRYEEEYEQKSPLLRNRSNVLRNIKVDKLRKGNEWFEKRINQKNPSYSIKKMEEAYYYNQYYKTFNKKFNLPKIIQAGKAVYNECDTNIFMRSFRDDHHDLNKTKTRNNDEEENELYFQTRNNLHNKNSLINESPLRNLNQIQKNEYTPIYQNPDLIKVNAMKPFSKISDPIDKSF